jgi:hypothetical protein
MRNRQPLNSHRRDDRKDVHSRLVLQVLRQLPKLRSFLLLLDVIPSPPQEPGDGDAGNCHEDANQPGDDLSQVVEESDEDDGQHQGDEADQSDDVPGLVQIARRLLHEIPRADEVVEFFRFLQRSVLTRWHAAMQQSTGLVHRKLGTRSVDRKSHFIVVGDLLVELAHVEVISAVLCVVILVVAVEIPRVVQLLRRTFLHTKLQRLLELLDVEEEHVVLANRADAGNFRRKIRFAESLVGRNTASVSEGIVAVDYANGIAIDVCEARDEYLKSGGRRTMTN